MDTVYNVVPLPELHPQIEVSPAEIDVTDSAVVRVLLPEGTIAWDLWIYLPDGSIDKTFADDFIAAGLPPLEQWVEIPALYRPVHLLTSQRREVVTFEVRAYGPLGTMGTASATVQVHSSNYLVLDRNVFRPEVEAPLQIRFKLSYRRVARLDIYDIAGHPIVKLTEDIYPGGWSTYLWDGNGQKVGSGVYLVTLRSGEYNDWKKFILVR